MSLCKRFLFIVILLSGQCIYGQDSLAKYFIIDTVVFEKNIDKNELHYTTDYFRDLLYDGSRGKVNIDYNILLDDNTHLFSTISYLRGDSLKIGIITDDKRSVVWLNHLERLPDTIRLKKWTVFHNRLADSVKTWTGYYHHIDDSVIGLYKQKFKEYVTNKEDKNEHANVVFILNNTEYNVPLNVVKDGEYNYGIWYHGYVGKNGEEKLVRKEIRGKKNIRYNKFAASVRKKQQVYEGHLDINP